MVFTIPEQLNGIAYQNKAVVYGLLFKATAETLQTIAADGKRLGAWLGFMAVLHTWGSALTHHPHVHCIVPGGGLSPDGKKWVRCRRNYLFPAKVLSPLFRRLFLTGLNAAFKAGELEFHGSQQQFADAEAFAALLAPLWDCKWVVRQGAFCRTRGLIVSGALHPPDRHLQQPPDERLRGRRHLPLEGLPAQGRRAQTDHDAGA